MSGKQGWEHGLCPQGTPTGIPWGIGHRLGKGAWVTHPDIPILALSQVPGCQLDTSG